MKNSQFTILICTLLLIGFSLVLAIKSNESNHVQTMDLSNSINREVNLSSSTYEDVEITSIYYKGREYDVFYKSSANSNSFFQIQRIK